jgi:hypothetical protein
MENKNLPAFPTMYDTSEELGIRTEGGLTKREYIATMAMQGLLAKYQGQTIDPKGLCPQAVQYADQLLKQLQS